MIKFTKKIDCSCCGVELRKCRENVKLILKYKDNFSRPNFLRDMLDVLESLALNTENEIEFTKDHLN